MLSRLNGKFLPSFLFFSFLATGGSAWGRLSEGAELASGSWVTHGSLGLLSPSETDRSFDAWDARFGLGYYFADGLAVVAEAHATRFSGVLRDELLGEEQKASATGLGVALLARWHFLRRPGWSSFVEVGWGLLATDEDFPPGGTSLNGTSQFGVGLTYDTGRRFGLLGRVRQMHVSNGRGLAEENPSFDGWGADVGFLVKLGPNGPEPSKPQPPILEPGDSNRRIYTQLELQGGKADDETYTGARLDVDFPLTASWRLHVEATEAEISEEGFRQLGVGLYRQGGKGRLAWLVDRQKLGVFTTDRVEILGERFLGKRASAAGLVGWEESNLRDDRWRGAFRLKVYPMANLMIEPGLALAEPSRELDASSIETTLNFEYRLPFLERFGVSVFFQDRADDLYLFGFRVAPGLWPSLRSRHRRGGLSRVRF